MKEKKTPANKLCVSKENARTHSKASEKYIDVTISYVDGNILETSIPIEYRRTGTDIQPDDLDEYLTKVGDEINPLNWNAWRREQKLFWDGKSRAGVTKDFFDVLSKKFIWCCVSCDYPANPNWARRIQDLKEFGYTIATDTNKFCSRCKKNATHQILLPIKRGGITGYETWSSETRDKIIKALGSYDSYEARKGRKENLLPDHKFPEIRWDDSTRRESLEDLTEEEMKRDFQLLTNQRNQQKREVCRSCYQTGTRGIVYGIPFYYHGDKNWDASYPTKGKKAEKGCVGCGWYDLERWRKDLIQKISS